MTDLEKQIYEIRDKIIKILCNYFNCSDLKDYQYPMCEFWRSCKCEAWFIIKQIDPLLNAECAAEKAAKIAVEKLTSTDTGSPKMPTLEECFNDLSALNGSSFDYALFQHGAKEMYEYLCRLLRADDRAKEKI